MNQRFKANSWNTLVLHPRGGVVMIDKLEKRKIIMDNIMHQNQNKWRKKLSWNAEGSWGQVNPFLRHNAPIHNAQIVVAETTNCDFKLLYHLLYSPDLNPSDFWCFKLKSHQRVTILETMMACRGFFILFWWGWLDATSFPDGIAIEHPWTNCIAVILKKTASFLRLLVSEGKNFLNDPYIHTYIYLYYWNRQTRIFVFRIYWC